MFGAPAGGLGGIGGLGMGMGVGVVAQQVNTNGDMEVQQQPSDSVSCMSWSPTANHLAAGSWDKQVRIWEAAQSGQQPQFRLSTACEQPVLCCAWMGDGSRVFCGGCDNKVRMWTLQTNQAVVVGTHDSPVKSAFWVTPHNILGTASWDRTVKYWDVRAPTGSPAHTVQLPERAFAADAVGNVLAVALGDTPGTVACYDLRNPVNQVCRNNSTLKHQLRCVAVFADQSGFAVASIEGRCSIQYFVDPNGKNFAFKCHRQETQVYAVNDMHFHSVFPGTFSTVGSDGVINFWDKDNRHRLKAFNKCPQAITTGRFNRDGSLFAYSVCYDWSKGAEGARQNTTPTTVLVHAVQPDDVRPKPKQPGARR